MITWKIFIALQTQLEYIVSVVKVSVVFKHVVWNYRWFCHGDIDNAFGHAYYCRVWARLANALAGPPLLHHPLDCCAFKSAWHHHTAFKGILLLLFGDKVSLHRQWSIQVSFKSEKMSKRKAKTDVAESNTKQGYFCLSFIKVLHYIIFFAVSTWDVCFLL